MPRAIPQLTYEEFLDTHARHYTLSNSYTILYGDLDIARELSVIGAHFAGAEKRNAAAPNSRRSLPNLKWQPRPTTLP